MSGPAIRYKSPRFITWAEPGPYMDFGHKKPPMHQVMEAVIPYNCFRRNRIHWCEPPCPGGQVGLGGRPNLNAWFKSTAACSLRQPLYALCTYFIVIVKDRDASWYWCFEGAVL